MKLLNRLERSMGRFAVPHLTLYIIFLQSLAYVLMMASNTRNPGHAGEYLFRLALDGRYVLSEPWRILTFIAIPPVTNLLFFFFAMYFLFLMGTALENQWGTFRYNVYLLIGCLATAGVALAMPYGPATNRHVMASIFLAFAFLFPDFQIMLFFIFPVKVKYIAAVIWIGLLIQFCVGTWLDRCLILAAIANFLLFFHRDLWAFTRTGHRRLVYRAKTMKPVDEAFNRCTICGVTEISNPRMEFRYCPLCTGTPCYCIDHMQTHEHRNATTSAKT